MGSCVACGRNFTPNPRLKNQKYCNNAGCQKVRRALWQRQKMEEDSDYRMNQRYCQTEWLLHQPGYYRNWRARHPEYVQRNRTLQTRRNARRGKDGLIAKMDSFLVKLIPVEQVT